jgi:hypothetical protein
MRIAVSLIGAGVWVEVRFAAWVEAPSALGGGSLRELGGDLHPARLRASTKARRALHPAPKAPPLLLVLQSKVINLPPQLVSLPPDVQVLFSKQLQFCVVVRKPRVMSYEDDIFGNSLAD